MNLLLFGPWTTWAPSLKQPGEIGTSLSLVTILQKWCEAFPTKDQKAQTVANILVSRLFSRFGPPQILHSDQGTNVKSNLIKSICDLMRIQKTRTTAYHPQGDGQIERQNRTLQELLSTFMFLSTPIVGTFMLTKLFLPIILAVTKRRDSLLTSLSLVE